MTERDPRSASARLEGAQKQLSLALEDVDPEREELEDYVRGAIAHTESARVLVDGPEILEGDDQEPPRLVSIDERALETIVDLAKARLDDDLAQWDPEDVPGYDPKIAEAAIKHSRRLLEEPEP